MNQNKGNLWQFLYTRKKYKEILILKVVYHVPENFYQIKLFPNFSRNNTNICLVGVLKRKKTDFFKKKTLFPWILYQFAPALWYFVLAKWLLNPFFPNTSFFYPLKTSDNLTGVCVFWIQRVEKGCIGSEWVKYVSSKVFFLLMISQYFFK